MIEVIRNETYRMKFRMWAFGRLGLLANFIMKSYTRIGRVDVNTRRKELVKMCTRPTNFYD